MHHASQPIAERSRVASTTTTTGIAGTLKRVVVSKWTACESHFDATIDPNGDVVKWVRRFVERAAPIAAFRRDG